MATDTATSSALDVAGCLDVTSLEGCYPPWTVVPTPWLHTTLTLLALHLCYHSTSHCHQTHHSHHTPKPSSPIWYTKYLISMHFLADWQILPRTSASWQNLPVFRFICDTTTYTDMMIFCCNTYIAFVESSLCCRSWLIHYSYNININFYWNSDLHRHCTQYSKSLINLLSPERLCQGNIKMDCVCLCVCPCVHILTS